MRHRAAEPACAWRGHAEHSRDNTLLCESAWCCCCHIAKSPYTQAGGCWSPAGRVRAWMCPPVLSNLPTKTEAAMAPCGAETRTVCSAVLAPSRSMAGARRIVLLDAKKATPAVALPKLTAAVMRRVYSVCAVCSHAQPQVRPRLHCSCLRTCLLQFVWGNAQLAYNACIACPSELDSSHWLSISKPESIIGFSQRWLRG